MAIARRTVLNAMANVADQLLTGLYLFVSYGILAREAGLEQVAMLSLALIIGNAAQTSNISLGTGLNRYLPGLAATEDWQSIKRYTETAIVFSSLFFLLFAIVAYYPFRYFLFSFVGRDMVALAAAMIVPALAFAVLQNVSMVSQAAMGALQCGVERSALSALSQIFGLMGAIWLVPDYGAIAAIWVRVAQTAFMLLAGWLFLVFKIPLLRLLPWKIDVPIAKKLLGTGLNMQAMSICMVLLEPTSRALIGWFGTMEQVAVFALAWRMVTQVRAIIFYASAAIMPTFGFLGAFDREKRLKFYRQSNELIGFFVLPAMMGCIAFAPLIGNLWLGTTKPDFAYYVAIMTLGFLPSTITLGSYHLSLSMGAFRYNLIGHIAMAMVNLVVGWGLGHFIGGIGVAAGVGLGLFIQGLILGYGNWKLIDSRGHGFDIRADLWSFALGSLAIATCWMLAFLLGWFDRPGILALASFAACVMLMGPPAWHHAGRRTVLHAWLSRRNVNEGGPVH